MSNLNIICKSDKTEFTNYFSEPLVFPVNAEISLLKANLTVPVLAQQLMEIPEIPLANRADSWIDVVIDGVSQSFTWSDFYGGWNSIAGYEQNLGVTQNQFYNGEFRMFFNNPFKVTDDAPFKLEYKTSFQEAFASMVNTKFLKNLEPSAQPLRSQPSRPSSQRTGASPLSMTQRGYRP